MKSPHRSCRDISACKQTGFSGCSAKNRGNTALESIQHKLQQFELGMVWLDSDNRISAMNSFAMETLDARPGELIGMEVLQLHPEASRDKIRWLLESASCPVNSPPPMTMMINIPERVLLIKVAKMHGRDETVGTCMVFYDLTDLATRPSDPSFEHDTLTTPRELYKLPVYKNQGILLVDLESICYIKADRRYSTLYTENEKFFCNLSLTELENRLDHGRFHRVHRSYLINLVFAKGFKKVDDQCYLIMDHKGGVKVPISRSKAAHIKQLLGIA
ncbi:MAG: LytTR family transcriptional regulator [Gammaproteobacteria bacterium]|nr:LytTR family transcriptional regulator [Gammaproteobacteria bacterium]